MKEKLENNRILEIDNLSVAFQMYDGHLNQKRLEVIHELSLSVESGEVVAIVGSSGSGKSILAHAIFDILPKNAEVQGIIRFSGMRVTSKNIKKFRGREMAFIPQSVSYLDPLMRVGKQVAGEEKNFEKQKSLFKRYRLKEDTEKKYPFQLSGGMARRVLISTAMVQEPRLIIADEPTPGLDRRLADETIRHFREIADTGCAVVMITHDIDLALQIADRIAVFYAGTIVESADVKDFTGQAENLRHPYTKAFIKALPQNQFEPIKGVQPYAGQLPEGCLFAQQCSRRTEECSQRIEMRKLRNGEVRCIHAT